MATSHARRKGRIALSRASPTAAAAAAPPPATAAGIATMSGACIGPAACESARLCISTTSFKSVNPSTLLGSLHQKSITNVSECHTQSRVIKGTTLPDKHHTKVTGAWWAESRVGVGRLAEPPVGIEELAVLECGHGTVGGDGAVDIAVEHLREHQPLSLCQLHHCSQRT
eukprot:8633749-Pyramimonas_sp.AAC.1